MDAVKRVFGLDASYASVPVLNDGDTQTNDFEDISGRECPEEHSSWFSRYTYMWVNPTVKLGYKRPLTQADLWQLPDPLTSRRLGLRLEKNWQIYRGKKHALARSLWSSFKKEYFEMSVYSLVKDVFIFANPFLLKALLDFIANSHNQPATIGVMLALSLFFGALAQSTFTHRCYWLGMKNALRVRSSVVWLSYSKTLTMSTYGRSKDFTSGQIQNAISVDADNLMFVSWNSIQELWNAPLVIAVVLLLLCVLLGPSALVGFTLMLLLIPANTFISRRIGKLQESAMKASDSRLRIVTEILQSIRLLKLYAWENAFADKVQSAREQQMRFLHKSFLFSAFNRFLGASIPALVTLASFGTFTASGHQLSASLAFASLALFNSLKWPLGILPEAINQLIKAQVSCERIETFLKLDEVDEDYNSHPDAPATLAADSMYTSIDGDDDSNAHKSRKKAKTVVSAANLRASISSSSSLSALSAKPEQGDAADRLGRALDEMEEVEMSSMANDDTIPLRNENNDIMMSLDDDDLDASYYSHAAASVATPSVINDQMDELNDIVASNSQVQHLQHNNMPRWASGAGYNGIALKGANFSWSVDQGAAPTLHDINLIIPEGKLAIIVGDVAAGKSTLLKSMLGEVKRVSGHVWIPPRIAYVSQTTWLLNDTLRENILFGCEYDEAKYNQCIHAAAMETDLQIIPAGDMAQIGEKGVCLSGGQKMRVTLARSVYANQDVYLLDEPLGAVDPHVGKWLFEKCICQLLKGKTRVMVTHQLQFLPEADMIILMKEGRIEKIGSYEELLSSGIDFSNLLRQNAEQYSQALKDGSEPAFANAADPSSSSSPSAAQDASSPISDEEVQSESAASVSVPLPKSANDKDSKKVAIVQEEERAVGGVSAEVFKVYFLTAFGGWRVIASASIIYLVSQILAIAGDYWLVFWSTDRLHEPNSMYVELYALWLVVFGALVFIRSVMATNATMDAANYLHKGLFAGLMRAPQHWFDSNPIGRALNRIGPDIERIDTHLPNVVSDILQTGWTSLTILLLICFITPYSSPALMIIIWLYFKVQDYYRPSARELKRIESVSRSPIYSWFSESVGGLATIRAYRNRARFARVLEKRLDQNTLLYFSCFATNRWLGWRLETVGGFVVLVASLFALAARDYLGPGLVGLSLTSALSLSSQFNWLVRQTSELEVQMNAVERVLDYSNLPSEAPLIVPGNRPAESWPSQGAIDCKNIVVRYPSSDNPVLRDVSFKISPGEKIGIVGRTGAGKSTTLVALFRLLELDSGSITIDGVDVSKIGLHDLRSKIAIIPQDCIVFEGSMRFNLDPFQEHSDSELWRALDRVHLGSFVRSQPLGLDLSIEENGESLSIGQRQLVCLARALLRKCKILVCDEATAALDFASDALVQKTIAEEFKDCTTMTVAHRINTVLGSDKIMVFDKGQLAEYDSPAKLLSNPSGLFTALLRDASSALEKFN